MVDQVVFREATEHDLGDVLALLREDTFHHFDSEDVSPNQLAAFADIDADPNQQLLVGALDDRVVATAQVTWMRLLVHDGGLCCQVEAVRTASDLRGRGIGRLLMLHVEDDARRRGAARIQLSSNRQRPDAHRFYERLRYEPTHVGLKKFL